MQIVWVGGWLFAGGSLLDTVSVGAWLCMVVDGLYAVGCMGGGVLGGVTLLEGVHPGYQTALTQVVGRVVVGMWVLPRLRLQREWLARKFVGSYANSGCVLSGCAWSSSNALGVWGDAV